MSEGKPGFRWSTLVKFLPAVFLATVPRLACPCAMTAYAGLFSSLGLAFLMNATYLFPLTATFLTLAVVGLAMGAKRRRGFGPFVAGLLASFALIFGKFFLASPVVSYSAIALLFVVSVWNAWPPPRRKKVRFTPDGQVEMVDPPTPSRPVGQ